MEIKDILKKLRLDKGMTQEDMANKLMISRQAISRWERGETEPGIDTLKLISKEFDLSINTLLGSPRTLICQCCGMPLSEDEYISREIDGNFNEDYCKWCYDQGEFKYESLEELINYCAPSMASMNLGIEEEQIRVMLEENLPKLKYWKEKLSND
ncbi:zinc ribbon domain-containing protein [Anaerosphaera multitolerans]|uniref:Helix-turn-helix domain-containing protein n=1 Tax=Anaerosphaera multitolerans TaxID=2487351 RepID=A0A437S6C0_9FIRM|nr:zinc ribbon domain-containing protein [Anaerosphaera multitolerans]RVU54526.1 helix-turn-helix domain-containing protein [Anaerosphaera multitolerans]